MRCHVIVGMNIFRGSGFLVDPEKGVELPHRMENALGTR